MRNIYVILLVACIVSGSLGCAVMPRESAEFPADDAAITRIIRDEIASDPELKRQHIAVAVRNGEVVLSGTVQNRAQESRIIKYALGIKGVRSVKDDIKIVKK